MPRPKLFFLFEAIKKLPALHAVRLHQQTQPAAVADRVILVLGFRRPIDTFLVEIFFIAPPPHAKAKAATYKQTLSYFVGYKKARNPRKIAGLVTSSKLVRNLVGAWDRNRTGTVFLPRDFKSLASTYFATQANQQKVEDYIP